MKKVICFARVSTVQQSLEAQVEAVKKQIIADGYTEEQIIYVQGKESAIKLAEEQRQTLNEMKELISSNDNIESIYFFAVDRLARRMSIVLNVVDWAIDNNINMVFLNPHKMSIYRTDEYGNKVEDELTKLLLAMLSYGAEMEMKIKKARFATAKQAMKLQGRLPQGKPIKGYYLGEDRTILVNETEASLVRGLFNDYLNNKENESMESLYNKYVLKGLFEPISIKYRTSIRARMYKVLKNVSYIGEPKQTIKKRQGKEIVTEITYPAILDKDLFNAVQERLHNRKNMPKHDTNNIYYGKGIVKCAECGKNMHPINLMNVYRCDELKNHKLSVNLNLIDSIIFTSAKAYYGYYSLIDWTKTTNDYKVKIGETEKQIEIVNSQIDEQNNIIDETNIRLLNKKSRLKQEVADRIIDECVDVIGRLNLERTKLTNTLDNYKRMLDNISNESVINPRELDSLNDSERLEIIKKTIDSVFVKRISDRIYNIHVVVNDKLKPFVTEKTYYQYNSNYHKVTLFTYYDEGYINGKEVKDEWIEKDVSWHLDNIRFVRKRYTKKGNAN